MLDVSLPARNGKKNFGDSVAYIIADNVFYEESREQNADGRVQQIEKVPFRHIETVDKKAVISHFSSHAATAVRIPTRKLSAMASCVWFKCCSVQALKLCRLLLLCTVFAAIEDLSDYLYFSVCAEFYDG